MKQNRADVIELFCKILIKAVMVLSFAVALLIPAASVFIFSSAVRHPADPTRGSDIRLRNDVLPAGMIVELFRTGSGFRNSRISPLRGFLSSASLLSSGVSSW